MEFHEALSQHKELYLFELEGYRVLFRLLTWEDFKNFSHLILQYDSMLYDLEDMIWNVAVIEHNFLSGLEYIEAGVVSSVAQLVLYLSGNLVNSEAAIAKLNEDLTIARVGVGLLDSQIKLAICEAFPSYKPEELDKLTWTQILERLAFSEKLLKKDFEFNLKDKNEIKDDSDKVFKMLNNFSNEKGVGYYNPE